jgi:glucose-1-phosphate thymidylyltransferase
VNCLLVLPAAGRSRRMAGLPKELFPFGWRRAADGAREPVSALEHALEVGLLAGASAAIVITSGAKAPLLMEAVSEARLPIAVSFVEQASPGGLGGAVMAAADAIAASDVSLMLMPDTILRPAGAPRDAVEAALRAGAAGVTLHRVDHPKRFGVARLDERGSVIGFVDKPAVAPSPWVWTSAAFTPEFLPLLERARPRFGEWGLTEALDLAARDGALGAHTVAAGDYFDIGTYDGYVAALAAVGEIRLEAPAFRAAGTARLG